MAHTLPILESTLTCPECGFAATEIMPTDACVYFYECQGCRKLLRAKVGDCCVFCSFGSVKWPPYYSHTDVVNGASSTHGA